MLNCSISKEGEVNLVFLVGELDAITAEELSKVLTDCVSEGVYQIVLEMSQVSYVSSNGLRPLLEWLDATRNATGKRKLALSGLQPFLREVFAVTEFDRKFPIYDNADAALESFL